MTVPPTVAPSSVRVRYAIGDDSDGIAALYDSVYAGGYPVPECTDPSLVRQIVAEPDHAWVVALDRGRVVGASMARYDRHNASYELCRAAVHPDYRGRANYPAVFGLTLRCALARPDCEMIYGYARSEYARRLFSRAVPWAWTGSDGGMHPVAGDREEHLFGVFFPPGRAVARIVPTRSILIPDSAVEQEIGLLNTVNRTGPYPSRIAGFGPADRTHESSRGRVSYSLLGSSRAAVVGAVEGEAPVDVRHLLWEVIDAAGPSSIEHLTIQVLADKLSIIAELCRPDAADPRRRFAVRGYLPGWHKDGELRYDCVTLVARPGPEVARRFGLDDRMELVHRSFPPGFR